MSEESSKGKLKTRIQYSTDGMGKKAFLGYTVNGPHAIEQIKDLDKAIERAKKLGHDPDVTELEGFKHNP